MVSKLTCLGNEIGLSKHELEEIRQVFANNSKVDKVILFGSRAMGKYKPGSDIDLAIQGDHVTLNDILALSIKLEELDSLIRFDLLNYGSISDPAILGHINRVGIPLYYREKHVNS